MATMPMSFNGGEHIDRASADAQRVADLLGVTIEFKFNEVACLAAPGGNAELLAQRQQSEQSRKTTGRYDFRFASSRA